MHNRSKAFTLVELILVMGLLVVVISLGAPSLSKFFRGRSLETEAGRFLAATRYGQSQAVSSGVPMLLWLKPKEGTYGLRQELGLRPGQWDASAQGPERDRLNYEDPWNYTLSKTLSFELPGRDRLTNGAAIIRFSTDGSIDESSVQQITMRGVDNDEIQIVQSYNGMKYEIGDKNYQPARRLR